MTHLHGGAARRQIVLFHVSKCGGTSVKAALKPCIGSKRSGRRYKVLHQNIEAALSEPDAAHARATRFVYGTMSWGILNQVRRENAFVFTMLRDPQSRLLSLYNFFKRHPANYKAAFNNPVFDLASAMSPTEFFASEDAVIRYHVDNFIVRQFSRMPLSRTPSLNGARRLKPRNAIFRRLATLHSPRPLMRTWPRYFVSSAFQQSYALRAATLPAILKGPVSTRSLWTRHKPGICVLHWNPWCDGTGSLSSLPQAMPAMRLLWPLRAAPSLVIGRKGRNDASVGDH